jgi:hypothetical protein
LLQKKNTHLPDPPTQTGMGSTIMIMHNREGYTNMKNSAKAINKEIDRIISTYFPNCRDR